jgi:hypothetical protein
MFDAVAFLLELIGDGVHALLANIVAKPFAALRREAAE